MRTENILSHILRFIPISLLFGGISDSAVSQTIMTPWGNITGMRVDGQPVTFEAGLRIVCEDWSGFSAAVKYLQSPHYTRNGEQRVVESEIDGMCFKAELLESHPGEASLDLNLSATTNVSMAGAYLCVDLPDSEFAGGTLELSDGSGSGQANLNLDRASPAQPKDFLRNKSTAMRIAAPSRTLDISWDAPLLVVVRRDQSNRPATLNDPLVRQQFVTNSSFAKPAGYQVYIEIMAGSATIGRAGKASFKLVAGATVDQQPVRMVLDAAKPGRRFDGIGGNFRRQFSRTDAAVADYNLNQLRVAWGRNDLPWAEWDPDELADPLATARAGRLDARVINAMETARVLARRRIPLIVSAWFPPQWARAVSQAVGLRGTALNVEKMDRICSSLASYLVFLKEHSGVEAVYFSFNEPETGVEVRQTADEHVQFVKKMGAELIRRGLGTRLLLGDTAHGTPAALDFIRPSLADPTTHRYLGAIAFHTWRGCTRETLPEWTAAAQQLGVPLLVTEAGPDAHLHEYMSVRSEPWFQLQEIDLYVRICAFAQPATIMEWQLTTDYSVLSGDGIYGGAGPLKPTQRFWNLKQLGATPAGAFAMPITVDKSDVTCAAFGDLANGVYAVHIVNNGAQRTAILDGLPQSLSATRYLITDANRGMEEDKPVQIRNGKAEFILPSSSYVTLINPLAP